MKECFKNVSNKKKKDGGESLQHIECHQFKPLTCLWTHSVLYKTIQTGRSDSTLTFNMEDTDGEDMFDWESQQK